MSGKLFATRPEFNRVAASPQAGFTMVEMLVVLTIIGLITALATPRVLQYMASAKVDAAEAQIKNLESALELYFIDNGQFPTTEEGINALTSAPDNATGWNGPYIKANGVLLDPWGSPYGYQLNENGQGFTVTSLGADKTPGGSDLNADLTN